MSCSNSVITETRLQARWLGFNSWNGKWQDMFSSPLRPNQLWGPPCLLSNGYRGFPPGVKWPGC